MQSSVQGKSTGMSQPVARGIALLLAIVAPLVVWGVVSPLLGVDLVVPGAEGAEPMSVGPMMIIATSLIVGLAGWALLALLERFTARGTFVWTVIATIVLLLSLFSPFMLPGMESAVQVTLVVMHIVVGIVLIVGYRIPASKR